jgi:branched-chain amino acid transport system ATP-binding protein
VQVLYGVDFHVEEGEAVVILGANGAGKTTTLRALSGMIPARGAVRFDGRSILGSKPERVARGGMAHVPQGRGTLAELTYEVFPRLGERRDQQAGSMSGGEQQMLAIARALMSRPKLVLLDEPSLGLAPIVTQELFRVLGSLNAELGISMLVVELNAGLALGIAKRGYVLEAGAMAVSGSAEELATNDDVRKAYLGI